MTLRRLLAPLLVVLSLSSGIAQAGPVPAWHRIHFQADAQTRHWHSAVIADGTKVLVDNVYVGGRKVQTFVKGCRVALVGHGVSVRANWCGGRRIRLSYFGQRDFTYVYRLGSLP
jgi:hypothetical protein